MTWLVILRKLWPFALAACLLAWVAVVTMQRDNARADALAARNALSAMRQAQVDATALATAEKARIEAQHRNQANAADQSYADLRARYGAVVVRLAADQGQRSHLPRPASAPEGSDGPGIGADVPPGSIIVTTDDALICGENTARLQAVHDWALGLEGVN